MEIFDLCNKCGKKRKTVRKGLQMVKGSSSIFFSLVHMYLSSLRNGEILLLNLVWLLVYSSIMRVTTSTFRKVSIFSSSDIQVIQAERNLAVNTDSIRVQYSIRVQLSGRNDYEFTRLVATE